MSDVIERIKDSIDIVEYIGRFVHLTKRGHNYFGLCPFHQEHTPSFSVNSELKIFKCFGCGIGGDIFKFVQEYNKVDFYEALKMLAEEAGISLKNQKFESSDWKIKNLLYEANFEAAKLYHNFLLKSSEAKHALQYLISKRQINKSTIIKFGLGYAPKKFEFLVNHLKPKFSIEILRRAGLLHPTQNRDKFIDRIMFPIYDLYGKIIGFSGRIINNTDQRPKYLNSPETPVFKKRKILYGLYQVITHNSKPDFIIISEGQLDVLNAWQHEHRYVVCSSGTSFTVDHINLLKRYTNKIVIAFDTDTAGKTATQRAIYLALQNDVDVSILTIPEGNDIDECLRNNPLCLKKALKRLISPVYFILKNTDGNPSREKLTNLVTLISYIKDPLLKDKYIYESAKALKLQPNTLYNMIASINKKTVIQKVEEIINTVNTTNIDQYYMAILLQVPALRQKKYLNVKKCINPRYHQLLAYLQKNRKITITEVKKSMSDDDDLIADLAAYILPSDDINILQKELKQLKLSMQKRYYKKMITEHANDPQMAAKYIQKLKDLQNA